MKNLLSTLILFCVTLLAQGQLQDWRPIKTDGLYMFGTNAGFRAIRIDSSYTNADTTHLWGANEINYNPETRCYNPYGAAWYGKEIINYPDCTLILNRFNESLYFPKRPAGEWIFYAKETDTIKAYAEAAKNYEFLGITDSVIAITLLAPNKFVPDDLILSKHYGLILLKNFSMFPNLLNDVFDYDFEATLVGIEKLNTGIQNLSTQDIFDFEPGDELHISTYNWCGPPEPAVYTSEIHTVIGVTTQAEINYFKVQRCMHSGIDTVTWAIPHKTFLDSLPEVPQFSYDIIITPTMFNTHLGLAKGSPSIWLMQTAGDSCYDIIHADKRKRRTLNPIGTFGNYIKGLGGPYYNFSGICLSDRELVYYKKGTTTWGTPFKCEDIVGFRDAENNFSIQVYPNPANQFISVEILPRSKSCWFIINNALGQQIYQQKLALEKTELDIKALPKGIFLYRIMQNGKTLKTGKFIKE